jgi:hypothetical protein
VNFVDPSGLNLSSGTCYTYGHYTRWDFGDGKSVTILTARLRSAWGAVVVGGLYTGTPGIGGGGGGGQQNPGGRFTPDQQADVDDLKDTVRELLKNPDCARVLGGTKNAQALMSEHKCDLQTHSVLATRGQQDCIQERQAELGVRLITHEVISLRSPKAAPSRL